MNDLIPLVGGIAGLLSLAIQGFDKWRNRKPDLSLFVPVRNIGDSNDGALMTCLAKISNGSERPAYLYWETAKAFLYIEGEWVGFKILNLPQDAKMHFKDLHPDYIEQIGINYHKPLNIHDSSPVRQDHPFIRLLSLTGSNRDGMEKANRIKINVEDSQGDVYILTSHFH